MRWNGFLAVVVAYALALREVDGRIILSIRIAIWEWDLLHLNTRSDPRSRILGNIIDISGFVGPEGCLRIETFVEAMWQVSCRSGSPKAKELGPATKKDEE